MIYIHFIQPFLENFYQIIPAIINYTERLADLCPRTQQGNIPFEIARNATAMRIEGKNQLPG